jgi:hypothetical protein
MARPWFHTPVETRTGGALANWKRRRAAMGSALCFAICLTLMIRDAHVHGSVAHIATLHCSCGGRCAAREQVRWCERVSPFGFHMFLTPAAHPSCLPRRQMSHDNAKPDALERSVRRIDCRRFRRARGNNCDRAPLRKPSNYREDSVDRLEHPCARSRDPGTCLSKLSFRKHRLAVVLTCPPDFLANSHRCREGSCIHGSIEVERLHRK